MTLINIPQSTKQLFWSSNVEELDKEKHQQYIIHQVLQHGDLADYEWLKEEYSSEEIKQTFITQPRPTYQPQSFNFVKNYLLQISEPLPREDYVTTSR